MALPPAVQRLNMCVLYPKSILSTMREKPTIVFQWQTGVFLINTVNKKYNAFFGHLNIISKIEILAIVKAGTQFSGRMLV